MIKMQMWTNMEFGWILSWSLDGDFKMGCVKSVCWRARASLESCNSARPLFWAIPTLQTRTQTTTNMCSYVFIYFLCLIRTRFGGDQRVFATRSWLPGAVLCQICFINFTCFWNFTCSQHYLGTHIAWTFSLYQPFSSFFIISHAIIVVPEPQHRNMKATSHMLICRRVNTNTIKYAFQGWTSWIMGWTWSSCVCRAVFCLQTTPWWACIICTYPRYPLYPWINFHPGQVSLSRQHWDEG